MKNVAMSVASAVISAASALAQSESVRVPLLGASPDVLAVLNDPAFTDRPVLQAVDGGVVADVRLRPFSWVDADGAVIEIEEPEQGWLGAYVALRAGRSVPVRALARLTDAVDLPLAAELRGAPAHGPVEVLRACGIRCRDHEVLRARTPAALAGAQSGLVAMIVDPTCWRSWPPALRDGRVEFDLTEVGGAEERGVTWSVDWGRAPSDVFGAHLRSHRGEAVSVAIGVCVAGRGEPSFTVRKQLRAYPSAPIRGARRARVLLGSTVLSDDTVPNVLAVGDGMLWDAAWARSPRLDGDTLAFALRPFAFRDVRGLPLEAVAPSDGWVAFYEAARAGRRVELSFADDSASAARTLPPPGPVVVTEPPAARVQRAVASPGLTVRAFLPERPERRFEFLAVGTELYWSDRADRSIDPSRCIFVGRTAAGAPWSVWRRMRTRNGAGPVLAPPRSAATNAAEYPTELPCDVPNAVVELVHELPEAFGYGQRSFTVTARSSNRTVPLPEGVELRHVRAVRVAVGSERHVLVPPHGLDAEKLLADWWQRLRIAGPRERVRAVLVVDGSLDPRRPGQRRQEWRSWQQAVREATSPAVAIAVTSGAVLTILGEDVRLPAPKGACSLVENWFVVEVANVLSRCPAATRVVVLVSEDSLVNTTRMADRLAGRDGVRVTVLVGSVSASSLATGLEEEK